MAGPTALEAGGRIQCLIGCWTRAAGARAARGGQAA